MDKIQKKRDVLGAIEATDGRIFSVTFTKRTTGETRKMLARTKVENKDPKGAPAYDPAEHDLYVVFDMDNEQYRSIPLEGVTELRCGQLRQTWDE